MKIEDRKFVSIAYTLKLDSGETVDQSTADEPLGFVFGSGQIIAGLEKALEGQQAGANLDVTVAPEDGYGILKDDLLRNIPRENFPADMELVAGMGFEANGPHGPVTFRVREVKNDQVVADFNHPLAGEQLHFSVEVTEVREPRAEELSHLMGGDEDGCSPSSCSSCCGGCS